MTFRIGQKIVCIKRGSWTGKARGDERFPSYGETYTVREVEPDESGGWVRLYEIINPLHDYRGETLLTEACFRADRFRPIVERKTDIGFATEILKKVTRKAPAMAPADRGGER